MDVEGIGYEDIHEDLKVVIPTLLVSNFVIFNCISASRQRILDQLHIFLKKLEQALSITGGTSFICNHFLAS